MRRFGVSTVVLVLSLLPGTPALAQDDTSFCQQVFSGDQGSARKEDYPARYITPVQDNGDGTYTLSYGIIVSRYLGSTYTADVYDCAFVDANGNSQHDAGETLEAVTAPDAQFSPATSSSVRYVLTVTIAAQPGDRVCDRAQVDSSYNGTFVDKTQYYCETLPHETEIPAGPLGVLGGGFLLGGGLLVRQLGAQRRRSRSRRAAEQGGEQAREQ